MGDATPDVEKVVVYVREIPVTPMEVRELARQSGVKGAPVADDGKGNLPLRESTVSLRDGTACEFSYPCQTGQTAADVFIQLAMEEKLRPFVKRCAAAKAGAFAQFAEFVLKPAHPSEVRSREAVFLLTFGELARMASEPSWEPEPLPDNPSFEQGDKRHLLAVLARILAPVRP